MKDELTMMEDTPLPEDGKIDRSSPTKWVVLLVLLFLVPTLVIAAILAHQAPIDWLATDVVIGVLTALFCTLIAVALILSAQGKQARKLEQTLQPVTDVLAAVRAELTQFKSAIQSNNHYILNRITNLEKSQHELQKSEAKINSTIEEEQALLHQMTTVLKQGLADGFAATTGNHETLQVTVSRLQEANELISEQIIAIPKSQDEVKEGLEREIKLVAEKVAILLDAQEEMRNDLREDRQTFAGGMTDLATNQGHFQTTAETLQALMQSTASNTANIADEQAALHKLLRENISAQAKGISITQQCQEALENQVDRAEKISQQAAASLEATQAMRSTLRETVESKSEELAKQLVVLLNNQYALQAGVDRFDDRIGQAITEITTLSQEQASTNKTLHTQAEALSSQMSSLSTKHEQVIASVNHLKELAHAIDGNVTGVAGEQALLQENLQDNRHMLSSQIEGMERNIQNSLGGLHERAARLVANTEAFEGVQTNLCQSVETAKRELSGDMAGIQQSLQEGVGNLAERTSQMAADIDAVRATQADLRLTVETAGHELSDNITGVQQSLQERVGNLAERTTKMTADIDAVRTTQTDLRQALETIRHELSGDMACVQQSLQEGIGNLAERTTQMAADISSVSTAQSSLCQTVEANSEVVANKLTALLESQLTFHAGANAVSERTDLIVAKVSEVATGQVALSEALHNHIGAFSAEIPPLAADNAQLVAGVNDLRQLAQMVADTVAHVADEQAGSQEILKNNARVLADVIAFTEQNQKTIEVEVKRATEASRQMATTAAGMADEQTALHNMIRTTNDELIGQCGVLAENQRVLIGGVNSVGEEIAEATAKVAGVISGQSALAERVQVQAHDVIEQISALVTDQRQVRSDLGGLQEVAGEIAGDINRIADAQAEVQRTVCGRSDALDESMQRISQRQQSLEEEVGKVVQHNEANHGILTTIAVEQKALQDTFATDNREMHEQFSSLSEEQHNLRVELNKVAENCQEIAASANTIATHQTTLSTNINVKSQELHRLFSALAEGQQSLEVGIREVNDEVGRTVADMGAMGQEQAGLHGMTQNSVKEVKEHVDTLLAETQLQLREGLDELREVNRQVSDNITLRADNQNEKIETLQHETEKLLGQLSTLIGNHGQLHSHVNGLREIAQNMAGHIKVLMEDQVALQKTLRDSTAATAEENAIATEYQQALQAELGKIAETNSQAMALLTTLAAEQDTLRDLLRAGDEALADQVKGLAKDQAVFQRTQQESANATTENTAVVRQNQEVLQAELSKIAETNSQTMALLATLSAEQDALRDLLRAGDEALSDQVKGLAKDQAVFQRTQQESANATTEKYCCRQTEPRSPPSRT